MRLTTFSDYALRFLLYAAANDERLVTIGEVSKVYKISRGHLMKVANLLTQHGFLKSVRGRAGGLTLAKRPKDIRLSEVLRATEPDFALVECYDEDNCCVLAKSCALPRALDEALRAFIGKLDDYTLEDVMLPPKKFEAPVKSPEQSRLRRA